MDWVNSPGSGPLQKKMLKRRDFPGSAKNGMKTLGLRDSENGTQRMGLRQWDSEKSSDDQDSLCMSQDSLCRR